MACSFGSLLVIFTLSLGPGVTSELQSQARWQVFNITCDPQDAILQEETCESESLETIADIVSKHKLLNVQINIQTARLKLTSNITFSALESLTISGYYGMASVICAAGSNTSAGIILKDISGMITLNRLSLTFCGSYVAVQEHYNNGSNTYRSALAMLYCMNVQLNSMIINASRGLGLIILNHQGGRVNINSTIFKDNVLPQEYFQDSVFGGGGIYIQLDQDQRRHHLNCSLIIFQFANCILYNNTAHTFNYNFGSTNYLGNVEKEYGRGGGVYLSITNGIKNIYASFTDCVFTYNHAFVGGGLYAKTKSDKETNNVTIEIKDSLFKHNGCGDTSGGSTNTTYGGGMYLAFSAIDGPGLVINDSHYLVRNVSFIENCAVLGGGVMYYSEHDERGISNNINNSMFFDNCTFIGNHAHIGSAVDLIPSVFKKTSTGYRVVATFNHCYFFKNSITVNSINSSLTQGFRSQTTAGIGTIYASEHNINFNGSNHFESNEGTAVYIVNGIINCVNSSMTFINNTGLQGGALALIGSSTIAVGPNEYRFINNSAHYQGGAIYVLLTDTIDFIVSQSCFIQYGTDKIISAVPWDANTTFRGNRAVESDNTSGHAIYATSLHPCQTINNGTENQPDYIFINISEVFQSRGIIFHNDQLHSHRIATDGAVFHNVSSKLVIIPGEEHQHGVTMFDDLHQKVKAPFRVAISNRHVELNSAHSNFVGNEIELRGRPGQNASLYMNTASSRKIYIKLNVQLANCPPGFKLNDTSLVCTCNTEAYVGLFKCDSDNFRVHIHPGYWAGLMDTCHQGSHKLVTSPCPFCDYSTQRSNTSVPEFEIALPQSYSELSKTVCGETRTGIVCGKCQKKHTIHFHSPGFLCKSHKPARCKLGPLFYFLSELLPITVFFIVVLGMNISFTTGSINGFILFCQLLNTFDIHASGIILVFPSSAKYTIDYWTEGYQIIYGFFNLEFFNSESLSFCLWKGGSALDMLAIKYLTILYTLLLIVLVIWIINRCGGSCFGKCCRITTVRTSLVHGLSTFLVICYTQCVKVSLYLLMPVHFYAQEGSNCSPPARVWLNGEILYFSKEHLPYAVFAMVCLLVIGILPLVPLLAYPSLNRIITFFGCENSKAVTIISSIIPVSRLKPLLDSIQGCFKDDFRFFAGLYFLYRWSILQIHMYTSTFSVYYTTVGGVLLFFLTLHTVCQPYIKRAYNTIDALLFINLILINFLSFFNYHRSLSQKGIEQRITVIASTVQLVLIYLPLVVMGAYVLVRLCKNISIIYRCRRLLTHVTTMLTPNIRAHRLNELITADDDKDSKEEYIHERILDKDTNYPKYFGART